MGFISVPSAERKIVISRGDFVYSYCVDWVFYSGFSEDPLVIEIFVMVDVEN